jgi:hypothetical protein
MLDNLSGDWIILNDLLLECKNTLFQIDTLLISQKTIYIFEVKNYEGDYVVNGDIWSTTTGNEIKNPLLQLKRCESLLRQLLQKFELNFSIEAYLIFINPDFTLYQTPLNLPIIFPTQLTRFMKKLNMSSAKLNERHSNFADQLVSEHLKESPYSHLPDYDYEQLKKGITCISCNFFLVVDERNIVCDKCGIKVDIESSILRSVEEFKLLFPDKKVSTNNIHEWCKVIESKKVIRKILSKKFILTGHGKYSYFVHSQEKHN